jgi:hypothetical protein
MFGGVQKSTMSGRYEIVKTCGLYNPVTNEWKEIVCMPRRRHRSIAILLHDSVLLVGGYESLEAKQYITEIDRYSLITHDWTSLPYPFNPPKSTATLSGKIPLNETSDMPSLIYTNLRIYAIGGYPNEGICSSIDILDPTSQWTSEPGLPLGRRDMVLTAY